MAGGGVASTSPLLHGSILVAFYVVLVSFSVHTFYDTPTPLAADVAPGTFSEARARQHVAALTQTIGVRSVSTPGLQAAHHYLWDAVKGLEAKAAARGGDVLVTSAFENYTGAFDFDFVGERFINAYHNISNIVLHISKPGQEYRPAVLLVAHHDSPVASPGAGDDASNIGVMLELASNLVASPAELLPDVPVMFLFSGAEEPLCQSASAFMAHSGWASRAGCFINLESIGPGGSPIVFQHAGAWTIEAFAKGAVHPRGAIVAQDVFDAGLVLGDTDYRQLSYRDKGNLPGIDIAYLLSGAAYHTERDTLDAIRPGVLQETGLAMRAGIKSLGGVLAAAAEADAAAGGGSELRELLAPSDHRRMFVSIAGAIMVSYSAALARVLHTAPLLLVLTTPYVLPMLIPHTALPPPQGFNVMAAAAGRGVITLATVLGLPAGLGALRALILGKAMVWFAHPALGFAIFFPIAAAVLLFEWSHMDYSTPKGKTLLPYHVLGAALLNALLAAALAAVGAGLAMSFALWAAAAMIMALCVSKGVTTSSLIGSLLAAALPVYVCCESGILLSIILMGRMSLTGHVFVGLGDAVVGLLQGLTALSLTGLAVLPIAQAVFGRRMRRLAVGLLLSGVLLGAAASYSSLWPYSFDRPKRLVLAQMHYTEAVPASLAQDATGVPDMRVANSSWVLGGADSNPVGWLVDAMGIDRKQAQVVSEDEFMQIYPISKLLDVMKFPVNSPDEVGPLGTLPHVQLLARRSVATPSDSSASGLPAQLTEVEFDIVIDKPCWGTLKLSGVDLVSWAIAPGQDTQQEAAAFMGRQQRSGGSGSGFKLQTASGKGSAAWGQATVSNLMVKFTSERWQGPLRWRVVARFVDPDGSGSSSSSSPKALLQVDLHVGHVDATPQLSAMEARMPAWATLSYHATSFASRWQF